VRAERATKSFELRQTHRLELAQHVSALTSRPAVQAVRRVQDALRDADVTAALRQVDRAWRTLPDDTATLAPIYARLLALEDRDHVAALRMLARAAEFGPDPDLAALTVRSLRRLRRCDEAMSWLQVALATYSLVPGQALFQVAAEAVEDPGLSAVGWVGLAPNLDFVGQLSRGRDMRSVRIEAAGQVLPATLVDVVQLRAGRFFRLRVPEAVRDERFHFRVDGVPLVGSARSARPDFALDGRAGSSGRSISGWARLGWAPAQQVRLCVEDTSGRRVWVRTRRAPDARERWPFELDLRGSALSGSRFRISAKLPDGRREALPDTPLLLEGAVRLPPSARQRARRPPPRSNAKQALRGRTRRRLVTDLVVAVRRTRKGTVAWLRDLIPTIGPQASIIVVDGAEDDALSSELHDLCAAGRIIALRSTSDQDFVASVNRALALRPTHDAALLDSHTLVFGDWLERLRVAAYSGCAVGTATPFINKGSIAGYPDGRFDRIDAGEAASLDALAAEVNSGATTEIPVGVGGCLYLRRDCLRDVGAFDQAIFGEGCGEVTDFCLRARARGWSHRLAADVFAFRASSAPSGGRRAALLDRDQRLLNLRHPGYADLVSRFLEADPIRPMRRVLDERRLSSLAGGFVLFVASVLTGGVDRFVAERCRAIRGKGLFPLILKPVDHADSGRIELWTDALALPNLQYAVPGDLPALRRLLRSLRIDHVEIQHFLDLDPDVIESIRVLDRPYDVYVHDFAWICPRVTLIDGSGRYCGEPAVSTCNACVRKNGSRLGEPISVSALRRRSAQWLRDARSVFAPSFDTAARYRRYFAGLPIHVQAYGPPLVAETQAPATAPAGIVRVALIGALGEHKGYGVLLDCARDAVKRRLPLQFVVIGHTENDQLLLRTGKVFVTGRYSEGEVPHLLRREQPHLVFMSSVWPETWCYALDHAARAGLPVVAFDLGAVAERLRAAGLGTLLPVDCDAPQINDCLLRIPVGGTLESAARGLSPRPGPIPAEPICKESYRFRQQREGALRT
jgi:glycosyltransferase involved in cell wall biosynthesis